MSEKVDLVKWKRVAKAAARNLTEINKPWAVAGDYSGLTIGWERIEAHVAESSPACVLALIKALEVARQALQRDAASPYRGSPSKYTARAALDRIAEVLGEDKPQGGSI